jgi:ribosomal protein L37AE/L43A
MKYSNLIEDTLSKRYPNIKQDDYIWQELIKCQPYALGWHDLIIELVQKIEKIYKDYDVDIHEFHIDGIKEKYGGLRMDARTSIDAVYALIIDYEKKSETVCEECGKQPASLCDDNIWLRTLCDECMEGTNYKKVNNEKDEE